MIRNKLSYLLVAPLLMYCAACVSEDGVPEVVPASKMTLRMKIQMGLEEGTPATRADKGNPDKYDPASGDFEEISTLRVIILHDTDREVEATRLVATAKDGTPVNDNLEFRVASNEKKTIVLIANEESLTPPTGASDLSSTQYLDRLAKTGNKITDSQWAQLTEWVVAMPDATAPGTYTRSIFSTTGHTPRLPLTEIWEVETMSEVARLDKTDEVKEVTLFMTRAAAKASFLFDIDPSPDNPYAGSGSKVTGIRLYGVGQYETVFPKDAIYSPEKYIGGVGGNVNVVKDRERYIKSFTSAATGTPGTFQIDLSENPVEIKSYAGQDIPILGPIYFTEYKFSDQTEKFTVAVELDGNGNWLEAQPLINNILQIGGCDAIARNTHLQIRIRFGVNTITWEAIEAPYNTVTLDPVFGI